MRRKVVPKTKPSAAQDDKKLQAALKKLNVQPISGVEEVNMFREDGNVLHFTAPKGSQSTFCKYKLTLDQFTLPSRPIPLRSMALVKSKS